MMASATPWCPPAKGANSKTPIGPFQKGPGRFDSERGELPSLSGPMSRPSQPSR